MTRAVQGLYDSIKPGVTAESLDAAVTEMREQRDAGFTVLLNTAALNGSPENVLAYADAAASLGVELIWPFAHPKFWNNTANASGAFPEMSRACGRTAPADLVTFMVGLVRGLKATRAYYVGDEPPPAYYQNVGAHSDHVRDMAGAFTSDQWQWHPRLIVHDAIGHPGQLDTFAQYACEAVGLDVYPIDWPATWGSAYPQPLGPEAVGAAARDLHNVATRFPYRFEYLVLQAFTWAAYGGDPGAAWPSAEQITAMRDQAFSYGAPDKTVLWWTRAAMRPHNTDAPAAADAKRAAWQRLKTAAFA